MGTERLFDADSKCFQFTSKVTDIVEDERSCAVILEKTAFFPEGGGQSADQGRLQGILLLDVREKDAQIFHLIPKSARDTFQIGMEVEGKLDVGVRLEKMRQHTGEHIVSGIVHRIFGYENVGFHLGDEVCTMDFDGPISKEELFEIEIEANEVILSNVKVVARFPEEKELVNLEYRSKLSLTSGVRIVTIEGVDVCACCAPHVETTGELGILKLIQMQNYKGGVRITMVCGMRAFFDYHGKDQRGKEISRLLSAKEEEIDSAVVRLREDAEEVRLRLSQLKKQLMEREALKVEIKKKVTYAFLESFEGNDLKVLANELIQRGALVAAVFGGMSPSYRFIIVSDTEDVKPIGRRLLDACEGKGGGKTDCVQGFLKGTQEEIIELLEKS